MLLALRFIQTESPTGCSSALRIRTTTTNHLGSAVTAEGGGSGQCSRSMLTYDDKNSIWNAYTTEKIYDVIFARMLVKLD